MTKKVFFITILAALAFSGCATFNAAKEPCQKCLEAWKAGDYEKAYSYFSDEAKEYYYLDDFIEYAEAYPVKAFNLNKVSISADGSGTIKGSVTLKSGEKTGVKFDIIEVTEDHWKIYRLHEFSRDILMED